MPQSERLKRNPLLKPCGLLQRVLLEGSISKSSYGASERIEMRSCFETETRIAT